MPQKATAIAIHCTSVSRSWNTTRASSAVRIGAVATSALLSAAGTVTEPRLNATIYRKNPNPPEKKREVPQRRRPGARYDKNGNEGDRRRRIAQKAEAERAETAQGKPGKHIGERPKRNGAQSENMVRTPFFHNNPSSIIFLLA